MSNSNAHLAPVLKWRVCRVWMCKIVSTVNGDPLNRSGTCWLTCVPDWKCSTFPILGSPLLMKFPSMAAIILLRKADSADPCELA